MNPVLRVSLSLVSGCFLLTAIFALPRPAAANSPAASIQNEVQLQAVSGKIASARDGSFTLDVSRNAPAPTMGESFQRRQRNTMTFFVDNNTTVDGKIVAGSAADVTYRVDNGNNMAVSVHVSP